MTDEQIRKVAAVVAYARARWHEYTEANLVPFDQYGRTLDEAIAQRVIRFLEKNR